MTMFYNLKDNEEKQKRKKEKQTQEREWKQHFNVVVQMCCFNSDKLECGDLRSVLQVSHAKRAKWNGRPKSAQA